MPRRRHALILTALVTVASLCAPGMAVATEDGKWTDPVTVERHDRALHSPSVERQDDGRAVAVWTRDNEERDRSVWVAWQDPGEAWSVPTRVSRRPAPATLARATVPAGRHSTRIIWSEGDEEPAELWTRVLRPNGRMGARRPLGAQAADFDRQSDFHSLQVASGRHGSAAVFALDSQGRHVVLVSDGSAATWSQLPPLPAFGTFYGLALGAAGEAVVVVSDEEPSLTTPVLAWSSSGGAWTSEEVGPRAGHHWFSDAFAPAIRFDDNPDGALALAWVDVAEDGTQAHVVVHRSPTGDWDYHQLEEAAYCNAYHEICADLAIGDDGTVAAAWQQPAAGDEVDVVMSRRDPATGSWGGPEPLVQGVRDAWEYYTQLDERINFGDGEDLVIAWHIASGPRLFFQCLAGEPCAAAGDPVPPAGSATVAVAAGPGASATVVWAKTDCGRRCPDFVQARTLRAVR